MYLPTYIRAYFMKFYPCTLHVYVNLCMYDGMNYECQHLRSVVDSRQCVRACVCACVRVCVHVCVRFALPLFPQVLSVTETFAKQLLHIPGVTPEKAAAIIHRYSTPSR